MSARPRIGISLDADESKARYELKRTYVDAVLAAGGLPILLPFVGPAEAEAYTGLLDGLVLSGGAFDVPPALYGEAVRPACGPLIPERTDGELRLLRSALATGLPVLGVCGGMQLLNVAMGGSLHQDLPTDIGIRTHQQPPPKDVPSHDVEIVPATRLAALTGAGRLRVNSTHHQAVKAVGPGLLVTARAPDGVIEAIELPGHPFAIGVQWHPEAALRHEPRHAGIYLGLVRAASERPR
ncbi:MAG TPA: gamma-glutamyl-gamma-aminobutyrate hydrolase family protein [Anaeromyxobacteraceae bacterium]|nr:gamma-glutamyl-gamma-aminobutyrate hydrolase family protein [Anaeromyxobacteraceae bacterium]